jgi:CBS domain-containing protein
MLQRKRAWDVMREDFPKVPSTVTLAEAGRVLYDFMKKTPEMNVCLVTGPRGQILGAVSTWTMFRAVEHGVLKDAGVLRSGDQDWDRNFQRACTVSTHIGLEGVMDTDFAVLRPGDSLLTVLQAFLDKYRSYAVVEEGGKVIGLVLALDLYKEFAREMLKTFGPEKASE